MANEVVTKQETSVVNIFSNTENFNNAFTMAKYLSQSTMVPKTFQNNISNCIIALDMAQRTKMSPFMVMQNIYIVYGNPSWSSKFIAALINQSRRYAIPLQYEFNKDKTSCYVWATDNEGNKVIGPTISIDMAKKEGWYSKKDSKGVECSKWQTMPEIMLMYRAVSFFGKMHCSDLLMGIPSQDEIVDVGPTYDTVEEEIKAEANSAGEIGFDTPKAIEQDTINTMDTPQPEIKKPVEVLGEPTEMPMFDADPDF